VLIEREYLHELSKEKCKMSNKEVIVLETDNGIIATALKVYVEFATQSTYTGNRQLLDRALELSAIFRDKDPTQKYNFDVE
jgi:hypothetical protein